MHQIVHCIMGCENPIDVAAVTSEIANSVMIQLPRFSSLLVRDSHGREHWRKTQVNVPRHVIVVEDPVSDAADEEAVNDYVADLAVHMLKAHNCIIFRIHHALGDGISLMSMLQEWCRRADHEPDRRSSMGSMGTYSNSSPNRVKRRRALWKVVVGMLMGLRFIMQIVLRAFWVKDKRTAVSGGAGVELWPRKLATAKFWLDDMKVVKKAVAHATINDVLIGVISSGLSRYLDLRSPRALQDGVQITGLAMVNLRKQSGLQELSDMMRGDSGILWGNKFGPKEEITIAGNPVKYLRLNNTSIPHVKLLKLALIFHLIILEARNPPFALLKVPQENIIETVQQKNEPILAITMHMLSYAGRVDMQILVAKDIIPDPQVLAKCFEDALHQMKEAATKE
ncbi:hypothetical protein C3L33_20921, partial [Rhododendron williamsianum]